MAEQFTSRDDARCGVTASDEPDVRCPTDSVGTANPSANGIVPTTANLSFGSVVSLGSGVRTKKKNLIKCF